MTLTTSQPGGGWCPLTGKRVFRSAHEAWQIYGRYRFDVSPRTFQTYVGKNKACSPGSDGKLHVEHIELLAQSHAWPPAPTFVRGAPTGGEGERAKEDMDLGAEYQKEKVLKARIDRESAEIDLRKKRGEVLLRSEYEQRLAAAAAIVGTEAETFVYDNVRDIIHLCDGKPEKEDSLREYLLGKVRAWLHAFSRPTEYEVELAERSHHDDDDDEGTEHATGNLD